MDPGTLRPGDSLRGLPVFRQKKLNIFRIYYRDLFLNKDQKFKKIYFLVDISRWYIRQFLIFKKVQKKLPSCR
jgi:hypothetical protein